MLNDCEYKEISNRQAVLEGCIQGADRDVEKYEKMKEAAQENRECMVGALSLYTNFLHDAIAEYEAAHPPEPPE